MCVDFKDSFENGFAPDPSLIAAVAVEAMTSFSGRWMDGWVIADEWCDSYSTRLVDSDHLTPLLS